MCDILMYIMVWIYFVRPQLINTGEQASCLKFNQYNKHVSKKKKKGDGAGICSSVISFGNVTLESPIALP